MFMEIVGLICEYNPFHNGHVYHINKIKELYPDAILVLVMSGYFTERGEVSLISKYNKTKIALDYGVDIVIELPCLYTVNSADIFAEESVKRLAALGVTKLVFGSESADIDKLKNIALSQELESFNESVREELSKGSNYPTALSKACGVTLDSNDLLGVSYIKAINKLKVRIEPIAIKRTNRYSDTESECDIVSALNIREKLNSGKSIDKYIPQYSVNYINDIDYDKLFSLIKYKIITSDDLDEYLGVDEGLSNKLKKEIFNSFSLDDLIKRIKSKRYTYLRLQRMLIHILLGIKKSDMSNIDNTVRILGFTDKGKQHLKHYKSENVSFKNTDRLYTIEQSVAYIYHVITCDETTKYETLNKPINKS